MARDLSRWSSNPVHQMYHNWPLELAHLLYHRAHNPYYISNTELMYILFIEWITVHTNEDCIFAQLEQV